MVSSRQWVQRGTVTVPLWAFVPTETLLQPLTFLLWSSPQNYSEVSMTVYFKWNFWYHPW